MASVFDPYHKWLGIVPNEQPPHHYRLLGLHLFESDPDVIANAADRQMAHVRTFQSGAHASFSQQLLNEIAVAKLCLLRPGQKAEYDAALKARMEGAGAHARSPAPQSQADCSHESQFAVQPTSDNRLIAVVSIAASLVVLVIIAIGAGLYLSLRPSPTPNVAAGDIAPVISAETAEVASDSVGSAAVAPAAPQPIPPTTLPPSPVISSQPPVTVPTASPAITPAPPIIPVVQAVPPATVVIDPIAIEDTKPIHTRWRFDAFEGLKEGRFTADTWKISDSKTLIFRAHDADGVDQTALLRNLSGKKLSVFNDNNKLVLHATVTGFDDFQQQNLRARIEQLSSSGDSWRSNVIYSIVVNHNGVGPVPPALIPAPAPTVVANAAPVAPPAAAEPAVAVAQPATPAPPAPATKTKKSVRYQWQFNSYEGMRDGSFTAGTWTVSDVSVLVFRRQDHQGVNRSTFLMGMRGKTLTVMDANGMVVQVRITAIDPDANPNNLRLSCQAVRGKNEQWRSGVLYTFAAGDVVDDVAPVIGPLPNGLFSGNWYWRKFESLRDGAFAADDLKLVETKELIVRRIDEDGADRHAELVKLTGKSLSVLRQGTTVAKFRVAAVDDTKSKDYVTLNVEFLGGSSLSWSGTAVYGIQMN